MSIFTWLKLGSIGALVIAAGLFYWSYQHRGRVIEAQKIVIQQHEAAEKFYKAQPEIDKHTQEMKNEINKATDAGDVDSVRWLYQQLQQHKSRDKSQTPRPPSPGRPN